MDRKERVRRIVEAYNSKDIETYKPNKNEKPEAIFMLQLKNHLIKKGFSIDIVESKGVWSAEAGQYAHGKTRAGFSDLVGNDDRGRAVYIEVKAPGKRQNLSSGQHFFLVEKIKTNAFAIACDSIAYFDDVYTRWLTAINNHQCNGQAILFKELPDLAPRFNDSLDLSE